MTKQFKVWCNEHNEWEKHEVMIGVEGNLIHLMPGNRIIPLRRETHKICWSTGKRDKDGDIIYLHDIVNNGISNRIIMRSGFDNCKIMAVPIGYSRIRLGIRHHNTFKIVGNEYSTPELMV